MGEVVAVVDAEHAPVHFDIASEVQVSPGVGVEGGVALGHLVAFEEDALRDACVFDLGLGDVEGVVVEVVVDDALANAVVLARVLVHCLLEVPEEAQHLSVVLQPFRRGLRDRVVFHFPPRRHLQLRRAVEGRRGSVSQRLQEFGVDLDVSELVSLWTLWPNT